MTDNVVNPWDGQLLPHPVVQQDLVGGRQFTSMDALLGELLREVLEMRRQVAALQDRVEDIAEAVRQRDVSKHCGRGEQEMDYRGMVARGDLPPNALRHGTPR